MDKSLLAGTILGTAVAAGGGALSMQYITQGDQLVPTEAQAQVLAPAPVAAPLAQLAPPTPAVAAAVPAAGRPPVRNTPTPPSFAQVVDVRPIEETINTPRQQCFDEQVTETAPARDQHQIAGIVGGALFGGLLGNQVGDGRGKDLATMAGAAAGAFGGRKVQQQVQDGKTRVTTRQRCEMVMDTAVQVIGYDVRYELGGEISTVRMDYHPGKRIALDNGIVMI
jgi:uncharacterized protein YcfJ